MNQSADQKTRFVLFSSAVAHDGGAARRRKWLGLYGFIAAVFAAATLNASPLYLAVPSEQTASDTVWLAAAEPLSDSHGGETVTYAGSTFPEALRLELAVCRLTHVCFVVRPEEMTQTFVASDHQRCCGNLMRIRMATRSGVWTSGSRRRG